MDVTIEKGIPVPVRTKYAAPRLILSKMVAGDSIFIESVNGITGYREASRRCGIMIVTRKEGRGFRIWHAGKRPEETIDARLNFVQQPQVETA